MISHTYRYTGQCGPRARA